MTLVLRIWAIGLLYVAVRMHLAVLKGMLKGIRRAYRS